MKNPVKIVQLVAVIFISVLVGYYFGVTKIKLDWHDYKPQIQIIGKEPPSGPTTFDFSLLWSILEKVNLSYYDKSKIDPQKAVNGAITGMLGTLDDPYTVFLPAKQNDNFKQGLAGQFSGIGAELGMKDKDIVVISPLDDSPAKKAGIKAGDIILGVDSQGTSGWTLQQAVDKIRGPKGTEIKLTVMHKDDNKKEDLIITRDTITVKSVAGWVKKVKDIEGIKVAFGGDQSIAYVRLSQFGDSTNKDWLAIINKLNIEMTNQNAKGFILDLRNNPGGYLPDAQYIASEFIKDGTIVIQEYNNGEQQPLMVMRRGLLTDTKIVVLLNKGSASASEIVAGALRDHGRAILVGETSFGKGTVQEAEDLGNGVGLHVTVAKWLTPNGTWIHGKGLKPDIEVALDKSDATHDTQLEKGVAELLK